MPSLAAIADLLDRFAPSRLAADWDNVGLLIGDRQSSVERLMTCLTVTPDSVAEAIEERADLIVTHHPFPFHAVRRITSDTVEGRRLLDLIGARVAIYSPHTAFDSAAGGINARLAAGLALQNVAPLMPDQADASIGAGRAGDCTPPATLGDLARRAAAFLKIENVQIVGRASQPVTRVGVACGSGGELLDAARHSGCDCFVTGEARFHTCLAAQATGIAMILTGHYASERFAVESLAELLASQFPFLHAWPSRRERNPLVLWHGLPTVPLK